MDSFFEAPQKRQLTNTDLYYNQIKMLKGMLEHNAITKEQYYFSASHLAEKMNMPEESYLL